MQDLVIPTGLFKASRISPRGRTLAASLLLVCVVWGSKQGVAQPSDSNPVLTRAEQIRSLNRLEAARGYPVRIQGVVTFFDRRQNSADVAVLKRPSWWTLSRSLGIIGGLSAATLAAMAWILLLRRRVGQQTGIIRRKLKEEIALEQRFQELFENATDMVYTHDLQGNYTFVNRAVQRMLGYTREELLRMNGFQIIAPEYRELSREMLQRKLQDGGQTRYEMELVAKDGHRVSVEANTRVVVQDGKKVGIHGIARDISERRKTELRGALLANLGYRLSAAQSPKQAAEVIIEVADKLLGWDACYLHLFTADRHGLIPVTHFDTVDGQRVAVFSGYVDMKPSRTDLEILTEGKKLVLRASPRFQTDSPLIPFGDKHRPSASLMFVPIRNGLEVIGVLSIQSYTPRAYDKEDLETLQGLADHCGGALERIRTGQALVKSEKHYRALIENSSDGISVVAADGRVLYASPAIKRILGYSPEEDIGSNAFDRIHPEDISETRTRFFEVLIRPGGLVTAQFRSRHKDGTWHWMEGTGTNLLHEPTIGGVVLNYRDVTARKVAEQALQESERRFHKAFQATPVSIAISNLADARIVDVNDVFLQLFGFNRPEVIGRTAAELDIWVNPEQRNEMIDLLRTQRPVRNRECRLRTKTGDILDTLISAEIIEFGNEPCTLFITYDLSERLRLEAQLRHSQKMEAVGQLAAGIAHDFNNIMTIIQGHTSLLLSEPASEGETVESLTKVLVAAERAASLTRQLLTFSRKQVLQARPIDLRQVINNVSKMLQRILGENISLECECADGLPAIHADAGMVEQIVLNLAVNARDAMPDGGSLTISASEVDLNEAMVQHNAEARAGRFVRLTVADTGSGMDAAMLGKIFEPFFTTKEIGKGTGLGLSMVYGIMKQHRGWIEVTSERGSGATFHLFFPAESKHVEPPTPITFRPVSHAGTETILIVEDEPALRHLVSHLLQRQGYRVLQAATGREALQIWAQQDRRIDLLLTDVVMPEGISGVVLAEELKSQRPWLKVIYTSGYSQDISGSKVVLEEGVNFLSKPYHPPKLTQIVRDCLDSSRNGTAL